MTPTIFQLTVFPGKVRWTATSSLSAIINTFPPVFAVDSRIFTNYKNQVWREYDHQLKFIGIIVVCKKIMILNDSCFYRQRITRKSWGTIFSSCDYRILLVANKRSIYVTCQHILKKFFDHWYISHAVFVKWMKYFYDGYILLTTCFDHPWFVRVRILCIWCSGRQIVMGP